MKPRTEVRLGERFDRAGEVTEIDVPIDDQALDLMEHRHVRRVRSVPSEHPAGSDEIQRRLARQHRPDLHRRGMGPQHRGARRRAGVVDEHRVPLGARRMAGRHVQRLEVEPVGFHLGAFGDGEPKTDEHVLEAFPRLGHRVGVAATRRSEELGEVESFGRDAIIERLGGERPPTLLECGGDGAGCFVERLPGRLALVGRRQACRARLFSTARLPRLPSSSWSRRTMSSTPAAAAILSNAASRAARMSSITSLSFAGCQSSTTRIPG